MLSLLIDFSNGTCRDWERGEIFCGEAKAL